MQLTGIVCCNPLAVAPAGYIANPPIILQIPANCFSQAAVQGLFRLPSQFAFDLTGVDRISAIVPRPILHEINQLTARSFPAWQYFVDQIANHLHDLKVGLLVAASNVIALSRPSATEDSRNALTMIFHINPIANVASVTIDRQ